MNNNQIMDDSIFKIGQVISVDGRKVRISVNKSKNSSHILYKGQLIKNISVGSYIKIIKGFTKIIGKVEGEYVEEDKIYSSKEYNNQKDKINRTLSVSMLGFFKNSEFERGIKELPLVYNECFLLTKKEFVSVHNFIKSDDEPLNIGELALEKGQEIRLGINSLFASHMGIFGNTGSGKSYTLAKIYNELFKKYGESENFKANAKFILIDFNGEYSHEKTIIENKKIFDLTTKTDTGDKIPLSSSDLLNLEIISILSNATEKTQKPFIKRALDYLFNIDKNPEPLDYFKNIVKKKIKQVLKMSNKGKAFMLIDYLTLILNDSQTSLIETIEWNNTHSHFMPRRGQSRELKNAEIENTELYKKVNEYKFPTNVISKLIDFLYLQIITDLYNDKAQNEHIIPVINKLKSRKKDIEKIFDTEISKNNIFGGDENFVVINLNDVNLEMKKMIPLLVLKELYGEQKNKFKTSKASYLNIIIDEAHNVLSHISNRESETWKDYRLETFEEIIKEGRKFGVFLTIASQRPSDISSTIISQLHNYFLHRLINNNDIVAVEKTISYLDKVSFEYLPILPTGTCIIAGLSAQIPVVVDISEIGEGYEPKSETIKLIKNWECSGGEDEIL